VIDIENKKEKPGKSCKTEREESPSPPSERIHLGGKNDSKDYP